MTRRSCALVALLIGCGKHDPPPPKTEPVAAPSGSAVVAAGTAPVDAAALAACAQACTLLRDEALDAVRSRCPDWTIDKASCDELDFTRNCIYATYGYTFKKARYKKAFGALAWYKPDPAFAESKMSKPSLDNIALLKQMAQTCRSQAAEQISPKTRAAVEAWFAARKKGVPPLPDKLTDLDGKPISKKDFIARYIKGDPPLFDKDPWEPIKWTDRQGTAEIVSVSTGVPNPKNCTGRDEEDCDGFEWIIFTVDDGKIIAIDTGAAG